jgi:hypothetical protein
MGQLHPSPRPVRPGEGVIQGYFVGGKPRFVQAALAARPALQAKPITTAPAKAPPTAKPGIVQYKPDARGRLAPPPLPGAKVPPVQLKPGANGRLAPPPLPPRVVPGRGGPVQAKGTGDAFPLPPGFRLRTGGGQPLPPAVQAHMEGVLGANFADVRVHVGNEASSIGALAFTHGSDVYFAPGQYQPHTSHGLKLIGHELTHVVQQRAGRVRNPLGSDVAVVQDRALEAEADRMGMRASRSSLWPRNTVINRQRSSAGQPRSEAKERNHPVQCVTVINYHDAGYTPDEIVRSAVYFRSGNAGGNHFVPDKMISEILINVIVGLTRAEALKVMTNLVEGICPRYKVTNEIPNTNSQHDNFIDDCIHAISAHNNNIWQGLSNGDNGGNDLDVPNSTSDQKKAAKYGTRFVEAIRKAYEAQKVPPPRNVDTFLSEIGMVSESIRIRNLEQQAQHSRRSGKAPRLN